MSDTSVSQKLQIVQHLDDICWHFYENFSSSQHQHTISHTKLVWQKQVCKNHKSECALFGIVQISSRCWTICNFCETDVSDMLEICRRGVRGRYEHAVRLSTGGSKTRSRRTISSQNEFFSRRDAARVCSQVMVLACWAAMDGHLREK